MRRHGHASMKTQRVSMNMDSSPFEVSGMVFIRHFANLAVSADSRWSNGSSVTVRNNEMFESFSNITNIAQGTSPSYELHSRCSLKSCWN